MIVNMKKPKSPEKLVQVVLRVPESTAVEFRAAKDRFGLTKQFAGTEALNAWIDKRKSQAGTR